MRRRDVVDKIAQPRVSGEEGVLSVSYGTQKGTFKPLVFFKRHILLGSAVTSRTIFGGQVWLTPSWRAFPRLDGLL